MNLIERQAEDFLKRRNHENHRKMVDEVKSRLYDYRKTSHKIEFLNYIIRDLKVKYDIHLPKCTAKDKSKCPENVFYENCLFFLQEELEALEAELSPSDFTLSERNELNKALEKILEDLNLLKLGQELTYNEFKPEFEELKDLYYLNKKNWVQLLGGKLLEMTAGGIVTESVSKQLLELIHKNYDSLIKS